MFPVIISENWLPSGLAGARRKDAAVLASAVLLLLLGAAAPYLLTGPGEILKPLHDLTHGRGSFHCPLCGGTRAFAACCSLDFCAALSMNPFAVVVFLWTCLQVPLRAAALSRSLGARARLVSDSADDTGRALFLPALFGLWLAGMLASKL